MTAHHLTHLLFGAIFVASLLHVLEGWVRPASVAMRAAVVNLVSYSIGDSAVIRPRQGVRKVPHKGSEDIAILMLDRARFQDQAAYAGRRPLDRCQLEKDIDRILTAFPNLLSLGIDFDLTPTENVEQDKCGDALLGTLELAASPKARGIKITLIRPVDARDRQEFEVDDGWRASLRARNIAVADPDLDVPFGIAHGVAPAESYRTLGVEVACAGSAPPKLCAETRSPEEARLPISFHQLLSGRWYPLPISNSSIEPFPDQILRIRKEGGADKVRFVLFGGAYYDQADEFVSPLGTIRGIDVHASVLLSVRQQESRSHGVEFIADVGTGVLIGWLMTFLWRHYLRAAANTHTRIRIEFAPIVLALIVLGWVGLMFLLLAVSIVLLSKCNFWFDPSAMALGMLADTLLISSVHAAVEELSPGDGHSNQSNAQVLPWRIGTVVPWVLAQVPAMFWIFIVGMAMKKLICH